jgi:hypothetical protein
MIEPGPVIESRDSRTEEPATSNQNSLIGQLLTATNQFTEEALECERIMQEQISTCNKLLDGCRATEATLERGDTTELSFVFDFLFDHFTDSSLVRYRTLLRPA